MNTAAAQPKSSDPIGAEELFRQGLVALKAEDWNTACDKFQKSMDLDPAVSTQFKLGKCSEHRGKLATAWYEFETALKLNREAPVTERRRAELEVAILAALAQLKPRVPRLSICVQPRPAGLEVLRNGTPIATTVLGEALPLDPGEHEVVVRAPGFEEVRRQISVEQGRSLTLDVALVPSSVPAGVPSNPTHPPASVAQPTPRPRTSAAPRQTTQSPSARVERKTAAPSQTRDWGQRESGIAIIGAGAVVLVAAGYFGIRTLMDVEEMKDYESGESGHYTQGVYGPRDRAVKAQTIGLVLAGIGVGFAGVGLGLVFTAPPYRAPSSRTGLVHERSLGMSLRGAF